MSATIPTEELIDVVRQFDTPPKLALARFFPTRPSMSQVAEWEVFPRARTKAGYTRIDDASHRQSRSSGSLHAAQMGHLRESRNVTAGSKWRKRPGGTTAEPWPLDEQVLWELSDMDRIFQITHEAERAAVLFGGIISMFYPTDSMTLLVNFGTSTLTHYFAAGTAWSTNTANIVGDIETITLKLQVDAGVAPIAAVGGSGFYQRLLANSAMGAFLIHAPEGMQALFRGQWPSYNGIELIQYTDGYINDSGTWVPYVPAQMVAFFGQSDEIGLRTLQGPAAEVEAANNPGPFSKTWVENDPSGVMVLLDEVELPIIEVPTGVVVITGT